MQNPKERHFVIANVHECTGWSKKVSHYPMIKKSY